MSWDKYFTTTEILNQLSETPESEILKTVEVMKQSLSGPLLLISILSEHNPDFAAKAIKLFAQTFNRDLLKKPIKDLFQTSRDMFYTFENDRFYTCFKVGISDGKAVFRQGGELYFVDLDFEIYL